jgi:hypothetical protein
MHIPAESIPSDKYGVEAWDLAHLKDVTRIVVVGQMGLSSKAGKSQPELLDEVSASTKSEVETPASGCDLQVSSFNLFAFWPWSGRGETENKLTVVEVLTSYSVSLT